MSELVSEYHVMRNLKVHNNVRMADEEAKTNEALFPKLF